MTAEEIRQRLAGGEIFIVPYCHADWAWCHTRRWHALRYVEVFRRVLEILRQEESFRWYFDTYITELRPLLELRPELLPELRQRVAEGKIAICGGYANVRPNMVGEETFIRSLILGRRRFREFFPEADLSVHADIVDVALGHPQLPQLLRLGGYHYARFWRPQTGLSEAGVPYEWIWRGLDGSEILCSRGCYAGLVARDCLLADYAQRWEEAVAHLWQRELEFVARHSPTGLLWLSHGQDDALPLVSWEDDQPLELLGFVAEWNRREAVPMRFATPVEFYQALERRRDRIPTIAGTLDPCDVCYNAAWAGAHGLWRKRIIADQEIRQAQLWAAVSGEAPLNEEDFNRLWEQTLLFSAHATQWLFQEDFDELDSLANETIRTAQQARWQAQRAIAQQICLPERCAAVLFNPLPYPRKEIVSILITNPLALPKAVAVVDATGQERPAQIVRLFDYAGRVWEAEALVEVDAPAGGYTSLAWRPKSASAEGERAAPRAHESEDMNNGRLRLVFENKVVAAVHWQGREWRGAVPFGSLRLYEVDVTGPLHVGPILATHEPIWESIRVVETGPLRWRASSEGRVGPQQLELETRLYAGEARIEYALTVDWQPYDGFLAVRWPLFWDEGLEADTPFGAEAKRLEQIRYGPIPGHLWDNNVERLREGMFYAKSFVTQSEEKWGLTYVSHNGDRYYIREAAERALAHILINSVRPIREGWEQHVNRQREGRGRHQFQWSLIFHEGDWRQAGIRLWTERLRQPLHMMLPPGPGGTAPAEASLFSLEPPHVMLSALYMEEGVVYVRVWEGEGRAAAVRLRLPWRIAAVEAVDFNGEPLTGPIVEIIGEELRFPLKPWEIVTLRLRRF